MNDKIEELKRIIELQEDNLVAYPQHSEIINADINLHKKTIKFLENGNKQMNDN